MLATVRRKIAYILAAGSIILLLLGSPYLIPSVHADPVCTESPNCGG